MKKCKNCGKRVIKKGMKNCPECGTEVSQGGFLDTIKMAGGALLVLVFIMALLGVFDDAGEKAGESDILKGNDTKSTIADNRSVSIESEEADGTASGSGQNDIGQTDIDQTASEKDTYIVGDTMQFTNGLHITVVNAGKLVDANDVFKTYAYIELEVENTGSETFEFCDYDISFYADDYKLESAIPLSEQGNEIGIVKIGAGRKAAGRCYALCQNYDECGVIEAELGNAVILIK